MHIGPIVILIGQEAREYISLQNEISKLADRAERDARNLEAVVRRLELVMPEQEKKK